MRAILETLTSAESLDAILKFILEEVTRFFLAADAGLILMYDEMEEALLVKAAVGFSYPQVSQMRIKPGESIIGKAFLTKEPYLYLSSAEIIREMADMNPENRYLFIAGREKRRDAHSTICFPLIVRERRFGVLNLYNHKTSVSFRDIDLVLLRIVSNMAALVIENAYLRGKVGEIWEEADSISDVRQPDSVRPCYSGAEAEVQEVTDSPQPSSKILVVDDELLIQELLREFLQIKGYEVVTVSGGKEAISKLKAETFDLVLLDIKMPDMDGIETLRRMKEMDENVNIIMVTGVLDKDIGEQAMELGAKDYVVKPFDFNHLADTIELNIFLAGA